MMDRVYNTYIWDVEKFFYNTGIHDTINKFNFLKSVKYIVSVAENGCL